MTTLVRPTLEDLPALSAQMETQSPQEILKWAVDTYGDKLCMATAFGAEGCVLLAMLSEIRNDAYIFNLDTGYQFQETLELRDRIEAKYEIDVKAVRSEETVEQMEGRFGGPIYGTDSNQCCHIRKIVPLHKAVAGYEAWITAIRRDQSDARANAPIVGWDSKFNLVKVNPLANWTKKDVWNYILANDVPYNPLHDQGYPSIGCWPCTQAVGAGQDDRAGRWAGTAKKECGLHLSN
ncbi:MAG TPA: phosphoadenylyl-sulfate reductase [Capsulimonadaceae bacterium]|jgi:phosphoadenosine phosphosulfate reductase